MNRPVRESAGNISIIMDADSRLLSVIKNNPFRILGVYANSSTKEIVANIGKAKAFLKVNKEIIYPCDFNQILPPLIRNIELVTNAESQLKLPNEKIKHALFWFVRSTPLDDIAFNHLAIGEIVNAIAIWDKKECFSSLLNKAVSAFIQQNFALAITSMMRLLQTTSYREGLMHLIVDETFQISEEESVCLFWDCLICEMGNSSMDLLQYITNSTYLDYVKQRLVTPIISAIENEINKAQSVMPEDSSARYSAGAVLVNNTKVCLKQLKSLLLSTTVQYQIIVDKLGIEILQCGIDYFNNSEEPDAALKAMALQKYALSIVRGEIARDRCKENVDILQKIIDELPPLEILSEDKEIKQALFSFSRKSKPWKKDSLFSFHFDPFSFEPSVNDLESLSSLLLTTKQSLQSMKKKMGVSCEYYWNLSELIVNCALSDLVEYVNTINNDQLQRSLMFDKERTLIKLKMVVKNAIQVMIVLDSFDMRSEFRANRYNPNRNTLKSLSNQLGLSNQNSNSGCMIWIVIAVISLVVMSFI
ncbi:hypothetical protein [Bacteroides thetaiotaomicron]|uniref:hypothetical protein n=1 Tax=Bacteroides thetaiotaomicron TaxID=818 RepID=UPI0032C026B4